MRRRFLWWKRPFDISVAVALALILAIPLGILGLLVRVFLGAPIFFRQGRAGLEGKEFKIIKFRTMTNQRDAMGTLLPDAARITPFGKFLRSTSLDELPELLNVIKGDMSLVGPRPLLVEYLTWYSPEQRRRHEVRPGLTGWAQVNGRNSIDWDDRLSMDIWYVNHVSFLLDLRILIQTVLVVLKREGVSATEHATMPSFIDYCRSRANRSN